MTLDRITFDPAIMGGKACIRGMRMLVSVVMKLLAARSKEEILRDYPYLQREDLEQCIRYASAAPPDQLDDDEAYLMEIQTEWLKEWDGDDFVG